MSRVMKPGSNSTGRSDPGGKGDKPRPVDKEAYEAGWDRIWGEPNESEETIESIREIHGDEAANETKELMGSIQADRAEEIQVGPRGAAWSHMETSGAKKPQHPAPDKPDRDTPLKDLLKRYSPPW